MPILLHSERVVQNVTGTPLLQLSKVSYQHRGSGRGSGILDEVSLEVFERQIITIIGPNGAGKTTLIRLALGLAAPIEGSVRRRADCVVGYVPQRVNLDAYLPVRVIDFLKLCTNAHHRLMTVLEETGATHVINAPLHDISGGELRRVLLARALLRQPNLLVLDEPTAGVDVTGQGEMYQLLQQIRSEHHCGVLLVSHDLHLVMAATDHVICLNRHICCEGEPSYIAEHSEYKAMFGAHISSGLAVYNHHHDHTHDIHGDVEQ